MMHVDQLRPNMNVIGSDGAEVGVYRSLSGQLMQIANGPDPEDRHFLDIGLIHEISGDDIRLLISRDEARKRWSEEG